MPEISRRPLAHLPDLMACANCEQALSKHGCGLPSPCPGGFETFFVPHESSGLLTEEWLKERGFKWSEFERQGNKHWLLWLGDAMTGPPCYEDIGLEISYSGLVHPDAWHCWLRDDTGRTYGRFIHIRHLTLQSELKWLIEGLIGRTWRPEDAFYGSLRSPEQANRLRLEANRPDRVLLRERPKWSEVEKDDTRCGALPGHLEAAVKNGGAQ